MRAMAAISRSASTRVSSATERASRRVAASVAANAHKTACVWHTTTSHIHCTPNLHRRWLAQYARRDQPASPTHVRRAQRSAYHTHNQGDAHVFYSRTCLRLTASGASTSESSDTSAGTTPLSSTSSAAAGVRCNTTQHGDDHTCRRSLSLAHAHTPAQYCKSHRLRATPSDRVRLTVANTVPVWAHTKKGLINSKCTFVLISRTTRACESGRWRCR
jgi:hypothetical protein